VRASTTTSNTIGVVNSTEYLVGQLYYLHIFNTALSDYDRKIMEVGARISVMPDNSASLTSGVYSFSYTGADQTFTVPSGFPYMYVQAWGAGGATKGCGALVVSSMGVGGGGGYTEAYLPATSGTT